MLEHLSPRLTRRQFAACCVAAATMPLPAYTATRPPFEQRLASVDSVIQAAMRDAGYPGVALGIEMSGKVHVRGYGLADIEQKVPMAGETVLPIGSVTKSFTGLSILQMVVAGKVDLSAPVGTYLPSYRGPGSKVAIRHLLNHTSGIPNYTSDPEFPRDIGQPFTLEAVIATIAEDPLQFPPGSRFSYSNTNTYLLGMVIEQVSGASYADYIRSHILGPFGMTDTRLEGSFAIVPRRAPGYAMGGAGIENAQLYSVNYPFAAGAIISTVGDLLRYRRGLFGADIGPALRRLLLTHEELNDGTRLFYTLGCLVDREFEGRRRISHAGDIAGYASHFSHFPEEDLTIAILTNLEHPIIPPYAISNKIARVMLGIPQPRIVDLPVPAPLAKAIIGDYVVRPIQFGTDRYGFIHAEAGIAMRFGGREAPGPAIPLAYQGGGLFVTKLDTEFSFRFAANGRSLEAEFYDGRFTAFKTP